MQMNTTIAIVFKLLKKNPFCFIRHLEVQQNLLVKMYYLSDGALLYSIENIAGHTKAKKVFFLFQYKYNSPNSRRHSSFDFHIFIGLVR